MTGFIGSQGGGSPRIDVEDEDMGHWPRPVTDDPINHHLTRVRLCKRNEL